MEKYEKMLALAEKKKLTAKDREYIVKEAAEYGIYINTLCPDCYRDAAMELALKFRPAKETKCAYKLRNGLDVRFKGIRINADTLTDELAERILKQGFPTRFFVEIPSHEGNQADEMVEV